MKDYSADAFKMAMCSHFCRYGMPAVLTADNGSQIWKAAGDGDSVETGHMSGALTAGETSRSKPLPGIFDWCTGAKGWLKNVLVYLAPTEAQHRSGMVESHIRQIKQMMRSSCRRIRKEPFHPFTSVFELDLLLVKICGLLNCRPIFASETGIVSIADILHPKISIGDKFEVTNSDILMKDELFKVVWQIFSEEVICGQLTKCGKKAYTQSPIIREGTIVLVIYPSRNKWKYGKIIRPVSSYRYEVKMQEGHAFKGIQVIDRCNLVALFLPKDTQKEPL